MHVCSYTWLQSSHSFRWQSSNKAKSYGYQFVVHINDLKTHVYHNEVIPLAGQAVLQVGGNAKSKMLTNSTSKIVNFKFLIHRPPKFYMSSDYICVTL